MTQIDELLRQTASAVERDDEAERRAIARAQRALSVAITEAAAAELPQSRGKARSWGIRLPSRATGLGLALAGTAAAVAAVAVLALGGGSVIHPSAAAAATFRRATDGDIVVTITNPFVAEKQLNSEIAAHGLQITVQLVPVSPSLVGTIPFIGDPGKGDEIQPLQDGSCLAGANQCPIGVRIPAGFTGQGTIALGRPAKPGEAYASTASSFAPGEALHCSGLYGAKVSTAISSLQARGLTVTDWRIGDGTTSSEPVTKAPSSNYVWQIDPVTASTVRVWTEQGPPPDTTYSHAWNAGCASGQ